MEPEYANRFSFKCFRIWLCTTRFQSIRYALGISLSLPISLVVFAPFALWLQVVLVAAVTLLVWHLWGALADRILGSRIGIEDTFLAIPGLVRWFQLPFESLRSITLRAAPFAYKQIVFAQFNHDGGSVLYPFIDGRQGELLLRTLEAKTGRSFLPNHTLEEFNYSYADVESYLGSFPQPDRIEPGILPTFRKLDRARTRFLRSVGPSRAERRN